MRKILALLLCLVASPSLAQWQVPLGNVPIGRGAGVVGFSSGPVTVGAGIPAGLATFSQNLNVYPVNADNGIQLSYGTGGGAGLGGGITFYTKNAAGAAPVNHQEFGFIQSHAFVNGAYNFAGSPLALVLAACEAWTPTANGSGFVFQGILPGTTSATGELSICNGLTAMSPADTTIVTGLGQGTINARAGIYDTSNRVLSASNTVLTNNQNNGTSLVVSNTNAGVQASAQFSAISNAGTGAFGAASLAYTTVPILNSRAYAVGVGTGIVVGSTGAFPTVFSISNTEVGRWDSAVPGKLLHGVAGATVGQACFGNATSGTECIAPATGALGSGVATLPAGTYNLVGDTLTQTLTNKTISGASNTLSNVATTSLTGTLQAAQEPAHTGDATNTAGSLAMTVVGVNGVNQTTGWATFTPAITCGTGALAGYTTQAGRYKLIGKTAVFSINIVPSGAGTCVGSQTVTGLPFTTGSNPQIVIGRDGTTGTLLNSQVAAGATTMGVTTYVNANWTAGAPLVMSGVLETN